MKTPQIKDKLHIYEADFSYVGARQNQYAGWETQKRLLLARDVEHAIAIARADFAATWFSSVTRIREGNVHCEKANV